LRAVEFVTTGSMRWNRPRPSPLQSFPIHNSYLPLASLDANLCSWYRTFKYPADQKNRHAAFCILDKNSLELWK